MDESILFFSRVSLSKFSLECEGYFSKDYGWVNLYFVGIRVFIVGCVWNAKSQLQPNRVFWPLDLATGMNCEFESRANCLARLEVLSCSAIAGVTLQLPCMLHTFATFGDFPIVSQSWGPSWVYTLMLFFTLSHKLPLHDSHLNIWFLNAELQANLAWNKAN